MGNLLIGIGLETKNVQRLSRLLSMASQLNGRAGNFKSELDVVSDRGSNPVWSSAKNSKQCTHKTLFNLGCGV